MATCRQDNEKQALLQQHPGIVFTEQRKRRLSDNHYGVIVAVSGALFFTVALVASLRYCSTHQCMFYQSVGEVTMVPSFSVTWVHVLLVAVFLMALLIRQSSQWLMIPLVMLVVIQLAYTAWLLLFDRAEFIRFQLNTTWQRAYDNQQEVGLLKDFETQWQCQGFMDTLDRNVTGSIHRQEPCLHKLDKVFGDAIYVWNIIIWHLKVFLLTGGYFVYVYLQRMDQGEQDKKEMLVNSSSKSLEEGTAVSTDSPKKKYGLQLSSTMK